MVNTKETCYILKRSDGHCDIVPMLPDSTLRSLEKQEQIASWGPFSSPQEAIAKRVGLIRSGKCQPI
ncbi:MAG: DDE transposase family protein [Hormoscilla sp. SP5CHS1]|nr:DDE transposase family protein [Hormoscilla sp. SP12CHS1]MBC6456035.1 DDE transposase family protein [Hormoscilla sp. SP5CHS1]